MLLQNISDKKHKKTIEYAIIVDDDKTVEKITIHLYGLINKELSFNIRCSYYNYSSYNNLDNQIKNKKIKINKKEKSIYFRINMYKYEYENDCFKKYCKKVVVKFNDYGWEKIINFLK